MASNQDYKIFGKKIFFLYPSYSFQGSILERLRTLEYEVYTINDYKIIKNILKKNKDSILLINVDSIFNTPTWIKFIQSIEDLTDIFGTIQIGVFSEKASQEDIKHYETEILHEAGTLWLTGDSDEDFRNLVKLLDKCEAKGIRQYVRANCLADSSAEIFWILNNTMQKFKLIDISAVGIAVQVPKSMVKVLNPGQVITRASLMLKSQQIFVNINIYAIKQSKEGTIGIFMFNNDTSPDALSTIRTYVAETLYRKIEDSIFGMHPDQDNYKVIERKIKSQKTDYNNI